MSCDGECYICRKCEEDEEYFENLELEEADRKNDEKRGK